MSSPHSAFMGKFSRVSEKSQTAPEILPTHTRALFDAAVKRTAELLRAGEVVALPTETVYGLAANARDERAVDRIFEIKGRPAHNPVIVHVASVAMARRCVRDWPELADKLAAAFWPGPLTLVLPRARGIPDVVTAGGSTVGVRWPSHPFIQAVIRECGFPLAAPSANLSNQLSPTSAEHVRKTLAGKIGLIIDGGQSQIGIESTVLDLTERPPVVLRPGMIHRESLLAVSNECVMQSPHGQKAKSAREILRSPGLMRKHYSPKARLVLLRWRDEEDLRSQLSALNARLSSIHVIAYSNIPSSADLGGVSVIPHDAAAYGRAIYAELHRCDEAEAGLIVVEAPPDGAEWQGIADRLNRAAS